MKSLSMAIGVALLSFATHSFACCSDDRMTRLFGAGTERGAQIVWEVASTRIDRQASWAPEDGPPPLAITKAVELGATWMRKKHPEIKEFNADQISLHSYSHTNGARSGIWYYQVDYSPVVGGNRLRGDFGVYTAIVLFDGTVVEPTTVK